MAGKKEKTPKLTKKQKGFVKDYIETGNGSLAAKKNYNVSSDLTARVIASENLTKPNIVNSIKEALPDELLTKRHLELLNSTRMDHMIFPLGSKTRADELDMSKMPTPVKTILDAEMRLAQTSLSDEEITEMLAEVNCTVRRIVHGETARHVYFWAPDNKARKEAIDMGYKVKGTYAPEKSINLTLNGNISIEEREKLELVAVKTLDELDSMTLGEKLCFVSPRWFIEYYKIKNERGIPLFFLKIADSL